MFAKLNSASQGLINNNPSDHNFHFPQSQKGPHRLRHTSHPACPLWHLVLPASTHISTHVTVPDWPLTCPETRLADLICPLANELVWKGTGHPLCCSTWFWVETKLGFSYDRGLRTKGDGHSQYHGWWCPGDTRSQGIISHDIDCAI